MALIQIKNLTKIYSEKNSTVQTKALDSINLEIEKGEFTAIAGPSGSGKTTLLNIIGALDYPTSGQIIIDNYNLSSMTQKAFAEFRLHKIGFVFQSYNLINTLTALENAEYVMLLQAINKRERRLKAEKILSEVGLANKLSHFPNQLSGGEQQRVAIARAIAPMPLIILADEPTANLDSQTGAMLINLMKELNEKKQVTFILATHDPMVMAKAKRLINLKDGRIIS